MGFKYEVNWYLVVNSLENIVNINGTGKTVKDENRIYPIGMPIPLIIKDIKECVGLVTVKEVNNSINSTEIKFNIMESFKRDSIIGKHYYDMYTKMKNNEEGVVYRKSRK